MSLKLMCAFGLDLTACPLVAWADGEHVHDAKNGTTWWDREVEGFGAYPIEDAGLSEPYPTSGIWVWEGTGRLEGRDDTPVHEGSWRKASHREVLDYCNGMRPFPSDGVSWTATRPR